MGTRFKDAKGFTIIDALISLCLIGVLVGVFIPHYLRLAQDARETALKMELANIRRSIELFRMLNERNPVSLGELIEKDVLLPARIGRDLYTGPIFFNEKYLVAQAQDAQGRLMDAFGNLYAYDPVYGRAKATTKGYESW